MTRDEWIAAFAKELGVRPPSPEESERLLNLASVAAHSSERAAAPLACWIAGCAGADAQMLLAAAERVNQPGAASPAEGPAAS